MQLCAVYCWHIPNLLGSLSMPTCHGLFLFCACRYNFFCNSHTTHTLLKRERATRHTSRAVTVLKYKSRGELILHFFCSWKHEKNTPSKVEYFTKFKKFSVLPASPKLAQISNKYIAHNALNYNDFESSRGSSPSSASTRDWWEKMSYSFPFFFPSIHT